MIKVLQYGEGNFLRTFAVHYYPAELTKLLYARYEADSPDSIFFPAS